MQLDQPTETRPGKSVRAIAQEAMQPYVGLICVLALAALVRTLGVIARPIWYDEAFAILFAEKGPAAMVVGTLAPTGAGSADIHPLGYYTLLWLWMRAFGEGLVSARALSILASLASVGLAYALTRSMKEQRAALFAALLLALSPFHVHYGQEIRMYAFLGLWLAAATYCYWRGSRSSRWGWWLGLAVSAALAQYTHNLAAAYLIALAAWPVLRRDWTNALRVAVAGLAALLLYLPWLVNVPAQFTKVSQAYWIVRPPAYRLLTLPLAFLSNLPVPPALLGTALFAALGALALGMLQTFRPSPGNPGGDRASIWMLYLSFTPPLIVFGVSQWIPVYLERAFIASAWTFCIWLACQLSDENMRPAGRWILAGLTALGFAVGMWQHLTYRGFPYAPYASIAAELRSRLEAGDAIVHSSKLSFLPSLYFDPNLPATYIADAPGSGTDTLAPGTQAVLGIHAADDVEAATGGATRVWLALFEQSNQESVQAGLTRHPHLSWLLEHYQLAETLQWDDLWVYLFTSE